MALDKHKQPLPGGALSLASPSNALVVSSDRPTRLENALKAFQNMLTIHERERLRKEMSVSCDASQVIAFTAGLDVVDPNRRGRSIATRLHSILETVQRFSEVVGIYVSSHPEIAALVWGSVRLAFTVLANFTSFFQTFSDLLVGFDTLTPQFKEYQILFPDSVPLRNAVYDFHVAIISCCTQVVSSTRRTWSQQAWASLTSSFETEIRPRIDEIREKAGLVKDQAALAKAQDDSRRLQRQEKDRKWNSLLLKLFPFDYASAFNHARAKIHRGTAEWIFSTREFRDWYEDADACVLNISGKIGSGKTILMANVVSYLLQKLPPTCSVSYLFVRPDDENSQSADMMLRSLIFQALTGREVQDSLIELLEKSASNSFERGSLLSLLGHSMSLFGKGFLVVDGLDQCSPSEQHTLLQSFSQLMKMRTSHGGVKIIIAARESTSKEVKRALAPTTHLRTGLANTDADLARYANEILAEKRVKGELVVGDETIMNQIMETLRTGGEGMFLWVFLSIEDICSCPSDNDIRQTLGNLPRELSETFNRALKRILSSQPPLIVNLVRRVLGWVATVRRPVTRWELGEALGVRILQKSSIQDRIINGTERIPGWCENLVEIEAGDETVRFFHHSINTHLLRMNHETGTPGLGAFHIDLQAWDHEVGEICLTYLNFSNFQGALTELSPDIDSLQVKQIAMSNEGRHIPAAVGTQATLNTWPDTGRHAAVRFLRLFLKPTKCGESLRVPKGTHKSAESPVGFSEVFLNYPFLLYATNFWLHHTFNFREFITKTWNLWKNQVAKSISEDDRFWASFGQQPPGFETFGLKDLPADQSNLSSATLKLSVSQRKSLDVERIMLHKAVIFADFIAHRVLLTHVLMTIRARGHILSPAILELLLPTRRVFRFGGIRQEYIRDENSHDGLVSLVTEFVACGGPMWPSSRPMQKFSPCNDTCAGKLLHKDMVNILSGWTYSASDVRANWLHIFARIAVLKLTDETFDAIRTWIISKQPCIHEIRTMDERDIVDTILASGEPNSYKFAQRILDVHEHCVDAQRFKTEDQRHKLRAAIDNRNMTSVEFYLQELNTPRIGYQGICRFDFDLLNKIVGCPSLPDDLRSLAISVAIPRDANSTNKKRVYKEFEESVVCGDWDVAVAFSSHGFKLANSMSYNDVTRSCLQTLDDALCCVSRPEIPRCSQGWVTLGSITKTTFELCARHVSELRHAWVKTRSFKKDEDRRILDSMHGLIYSASTSSP